MSTGSSGGLQQICHIDAEHRLNIHLLGRTVERYNYTHDSLFVRLWNAGTQLTLISNSKRNGTTFISISSGR